MSVLIAIVASSGEVYGITGNYQADSIPYVGIVVLFSDAARTNAIGYCSGVLISPTVMLTAGHNTFGVAAVSVCFDKGPIDYTIKDGKLDYQTNEAIYTGKQITYEEYEDSVGITRGNHVFSASDLGLIILDTPVEGVKDFPKLPAPGLADTLDSKTNLQEVGYGAQFQVIPRNDETQSSYAGTLSCNSAQAQIIAGNFAGSDRYLKLTANPSQGKGGVSFGDSGGPVLFNGNNGEQSIVLAINAFVDNSNCAGVTYHARIDTLQVLGWIYEKSGVQ